MIFKSTNIFLFLFVAAGHLLAQEIRDPDGLYLLFTPNEVHSPFDFFYEQLHGEKYGLRDTTIKRLTNKKIDDITRFTGKCISYQYGNKHAKARFKSGRFHGKVTVFGCGDESNLIQEESEWKNGRREGYVKIYEHGILHKISKWKDNYPIGVFKTFYSRTTQLEYEVYYLNKRTPIAQKLVAYFHNGKVKLEIDYVKHTYKELNINGTNRLTGYFDSNCHKDSIWTSFDSLGVKINEIPYKDGKMNGVARYYVNDFEYSNKYFKNDILKLTRDSLTFYPSGHKIFEVDSATRLFKTYYKTGSIMSEGHRTEEGLKDGVWLYYDLNENKYCEENYSSGAHDGWWYYFWPTGKESRYYHINYLEKKFVYYPDNTSVKEEWSPYKNIGYYENGKIKFEGKLHNGRKDGEYKYYNEKGKITNVKVFHWYEQDR